MECIPKMKTLKIMFTEVVYTRQERVPLQRVPLKSGVTRICAEPQVSPFLWGSFQNGWIGTELLRKGPLLIGIVSGLLYGVHLWPDWEPAEWSAGSPAAVTFCRISSLDHPFLIQMWAHSLNGERMFALGHSSLLVSVLMGQLNVCIMESHNISTIDGPKALEPTVRMAYCMRSN